MVKRKYFVIVVVVGILSSLCLSCANNSLTNTTWQDTAGIRTITFNESTFRWIRKDEGRDLMGAYTIAKDAVVLSFDDGDRYTGALVGGVLSFTVNPGHRTEEAHVEFYRK
jgi:hypothetical protein